MLSKWIVLFCLTIVQGQDPRKRYLTPLEVEEYELNKNDDDISCSFGNCVKRSSNQDELGPFWANRGKKDPNYTRERLFAEEPHWILVRRDDKYLSDNKDPFFVTRGKKDLEILRDSKYWKNINGVRERRYFAAEGIDSPFFAARGKKEDRI